MIHRDGVHERTRRRTLLNRRRHNELRSSGGTEGRTLHDSQSRNNMHSLSPLTAIVVTVFLSATVLSSCKTTALMVPVEGPLSLLRPVPQITILAKGVEGFKGTLSFTLPENDACSGRWSSTASGPTFTSGSLIGQYRTTYLSSYSIGGSGQNLGQAIATCTSGRIVDVQFVTGNGTATGFGIAKDSENNVYRLVF